MNTHAIDENLCKKAEVWLKKQSAEWEEPVAVPPDGRIGRRSEQIAPPAATGRNADGVQDWEGQRAMEHIFESAPGPLEAAYAQAPEAANSLAATGHALMYPGGTPGSPGLQNWLPESTKPGDTQYIPDDMSHLIPGMGSEPPLSGQLPDPGMTKMNAYSIDEALCKQAEGSFAESSANNIMSAAGQLAEGQKLQLPRVPVGKATGLGAAGGSLLGAGMFMGGRGVANLFREEEEDKPMLPAALWGLGLGGATGAGAGAGTAGLANMGMETIENLADPEAMAEVVGNAIKSPRTQQLVGDQLRQAFESPETQQAALQQLGLDEATVQQALSGQ